jgi:hypothetical protein
MLPFGPIFDSREAPKDRMGTFAKNSDYSQIFEQMAESGYRLMSTE